MIGLELNQRKIMYIFGNYLPFYLIASKGNETDLLM